MLKNFFRKNFFTQTMRMGYFFVEKCFSPRGLLGAARYCAEGTICNDRRSLQIQLGV